MKTKIIIPDSLSCICCGEIGVPVARERARMRVSLWHPEDARMRLA